MKRSRLIFPIVFALALLVTGCHSGKKTVRRGYDEVKTEQKGPEKSPKTSKSKIVDPALAKRIIKEARSWLGVKYKYAGETKAGVDCSGLVMVVYRDVAGIKLPRNSRLQQEFCEPLKKSDLSPGDLVFFTIKIKDQVSHVGIYIGNDEFIHASSSKGVVISRMDQDYYIRHFHSAGRVPSIPVVKQ